VKPLAIVVAMAENRVIGKDGGLPWHIPEDLEHFRRVTTPHAIIMGRKTHLSIGKALPGRRNIVITSKPEQIAPGCEVASSLEAAIELARTEDDAPRIVGGAQVYAAALPLATQIFLTEVSREVEGDTLFPAIDEADWVESERREGDGVVYRTLVRR